MESDGDEEEDVVGGVGWCTVDVVRECCGGREVTSGGVTLLDELG